MQGRTSENPAARAIFFSGVFKPGLLEKNADGLHNEHPADNDEHQFLFDQNGDRGNAATDGEAPGIAHKHFGRMAVKPEEAESRTEQGTAKNS